MSFGVIGYGSDFLSKKIFTTATTAAGTISVVSVVLRFFFAFDPGRLAVRLVGTTSSDFVFLPCLVVFVLFSFFF